jgi:hypothetical protein
MRLQNMKAAETTEQIKLFNWAKSRENIVPELRLMYHIPNEGKRSKSGGEILKAAGLRAGVPDICLPVARMGYNALYIEMKFGDNKPTKAQREYMAALEAAGAKVTVCYSAETAREVIRHYLSPAEGFNLVNCEEAVKTVNGCEGYDLPFAPCDKCKKHINHTPKGETRKC